MTFFSVIIPLYNKENFIKSTLTSVLSQTYNNFEVIIVDDCSTDGSLSRVNDILDSRIKILKHEKNKGLSASRNTGIKNATADYVAFLDADDLWKPSFLEKINLLITQYQEASLFATKYEVLLEKDRILIHDFRLKEIENHGIISNFFLSNLNQSIFYPSCLCVRKSVFEDVGYYNEKVDYSEDIDFNIRANVKYKLAYYNEPLVTYLLVSENQITHNGLVGKTVPDYDYYQNIYKDRKDVKKYIDFQRYIKAKLFRLGNDSEGYKKMVANIDLHNLNWKQRVLLKAPKFALAYISTFKKIIRILGFDVNSY